MAFLKRRVRPLLVVEPTRTSEVTTYWRQQAPSCPAAPAHTDLTRPRPHRKNLTPLRGILIRVKKVVFLASVALLVLTLKYLDGGRFPAARHATLPFKVALLSVKEADRRLAVPVEGVRVEQVSDSWHAPRPGGRLHEGQDIFAARGTAVRPAAEGYVVRMGESPLGGNTVWVTGAGGRSYYYAHLDSYAPDLRVGDYVTTESVLGFVGTTGNAAGGAPHLHFGVYAAGGAIDPRPLLTDRPEAARPAPGKARRPKV
jgi:murein DD-endopeptidase MepM/ murein hydrolase activator NlpD